MVYNDSLGFFEKVDSLSDCELVGNGNKDVCTSAENGNKDVCESVENGDIVVCGSVEFGDVDASRLKLVENDSMVVCGPVENVPEDFLVVDASELPVRGEVKKGYIINLYG